MLVLLFLFLQLPPSTGPTTLRHITGDNDNEAYQVLIWFGMDFMDVFDLSNNILAPGIVVGMEKVTDHWVVGQLDQLRYKVIDNTQVISSDMMLLESQLITKKYTIEGQVRSELSLVLGPLILDLFLTPFCYKQMYDCVFGLGKKTSATKNAVSSSDLKSLIYLNEWKDNNNLYIDRSVAGPEQANYNLINSLFAQFSWTFEHTAIFADLGEGMEQANDLVLGLVYHGISETIVEIDDRYNYTDANHALLNVIPYKCRVVLLFGSQRMVRDMMLQAHAAGMTESNEYVFIIIPANYYPLYDWKANGEGLLYDETQINMDEAAKKAFQSAFIVTAEINTSLFDEFSTRVKERSLEEPFDYTFPEGKEVPLWAANYHDAVLLWTYAMNNYYSDTNQSISVQKLYDYTYTKDDFNGIEPITGPIELDEFGDRVNSFIFWHLNESYQWVAVGRYSKVGSDYVYTELLKEDKIFWPNGQKSAPPAVPECGFKGELCDNSLTIGIGAGAGALVLLLLCIGILTHMYRKAKFEAALAAMSWKISPLEIRDVGRDPLGSSVFGSKKSSIAGSRSSDASLSSNPSNVKKKSYQFFSKRAQYQNKIVALKTVLPQYMSVNRALMIEMKTLKELRNDNLLTVYGAMVDNDISFLVTEYCSKGSLQDLLENEDVKLDDMLKFSLINDLAKGMRFLHASVIGSHGYLKSSNCIINNHFSLKISDFSKSIFMSDMERLNRATEEARNERLVYRAPELLRMQCVPCQGDREADIYSFGIVVHEILVREGPFGLSNMECDLTATEVISMVTKTDAQTPFRPEFPFSSDYKITRMTLMAKECWNEDPVARPTFTMTRTTLRSIRVDSSGGIVENLLGRMEKYATNLEELVEERTAQLQVEKKKTDDLLESMLPKSVADQLKSGHMVPPEKFESVTIYFSDIVGFTAISSLSKPMEVLDMLNDLYTVFDTCIEKYDCYKVETIGDAYMVVSGLPVRNGDRHAAQIALMSLDFLTCVKHFVISHLPEKKLVIRIGMHSGPVVAGIVGKKMPRYCLFGDTVNTASRMESNGEALKIQMSSQSYDILSNHGGFEIQAREGLIDMKGKGLQQTYWLQGIEKDLNIDNPRHFTDHTALLKKENSTKILIDSPKDKKSILPALPSPSIPDFLNYNNLNHGDSKNHKVHLNNKEFSNS